MLRGIFVRKIPAVFHEYNSLYNIQQIGSQQWHHMKRQTTIQIHFSNTMLSAQPPQQSHYIGDILHDLFGCFEMVAFYP